MKYVRIFADANDDSHLADVEVETTKQELFPDLPLIDFSSFIPLEGMLLLHIPGHISEADWHTAPRRQFVMFLSGQVEIEVSDGERRTINPHDLVLAEDTRGKGHITRRLGEEDQIVMFLPVADGAEL